MLHNHSNYRELFSFPCLILLLLIHVLYLGIYIMYMKIVYLGTLFLFSVIVYSIDCVFSPDEQTVVTGVSVRRGEVCVCVCVCVMCSTLYGSTDSHTHCTVYHVLLLLLSSLLRGQGGCCSTTGSSRKYTGWLHQTL